MYGSLYCGKFPPWEMGFKADETRRHMMCTWRVFLRNSLPLLTFALLLAGCAASGATGAQTQPTGTAVAQTQPTPTPPPTPTPTSTPLPSCPPNNIPTNGSINEPVIAPHGWKT